MEEVNTFTAPIAGQSLTTEPKGYSWERPSEMNEVPQVIDFYIDKLGDQAVMDDVFTALDNGGLAYNRCKFNNFSCIT